MARPKKDPTMLMNFDLRIPVTAMQKRTIAKAASANQADMASWLRPIILDAARDALKRSRKKADRDIAAGRMRRFSSVEGMIADLNSGE
jgi:hypothetical protein